MSSDILLAPYAPSLPVAGPVRLAVSWQHPTTRSHEAVGVLECREGGYEFRYLSRAHDVVGFQPFLGFDDLDRSYSSARLFPLFAQRVMSPARADYPRYLEALWLPTQAQDWQILDRSQGQREGDGIRVVLEPAVEEDGETSSVFFVNGIRHRLRADPALSTVLDSLRAGDPLTLVAEPHNPVDARAVLVSQRFGDAIGWVPSLLVDWVHEVRSSREPDVIVVRVNGPDVPPGFRLLVRVTGRARPGFGSFWGPDWR